MENPVLVMAFYHFAAFADYRAWQKPLKTFCQARNLRGTTLLAEEGINGTMSGTPEAIHDLLAYLRTISGFEKLEAKFAENQNIPFQRLKIRLKKEIVTLGVDGVNPSEQVGIYVKPEDWDELLRDPEMLLIDTRNDYEIELGTFPNAINPKTQKFNEFPKFIEKNFDKNQHKKVAMFCTGGIRCEKASAFMLKIGFENVYHLKGGILKYLEDIPREKSTWNGDCFVFDERVGVGIGLEPNPALISNICPECNFRAPNCKCMA